MQPWDGVIPETEQSNYRAAGLGKPVVFGTRPALLIIDVQYRTVGTTPKPFLEAIKEFPTSCGETAWASVANIKLLLTEFRKCGWPVLYPHIAPKVSTDGGRLAEKMPGIMTIPARGYEFVPDIAPRAGDVLIPKKHPSAFFATPLTSHLVDLGVDSLVVTGCTTSGCVRSSVVDAFAYNFRACVPHDAVYDRSYTSHCVNLFDMAGKYANVASTEETLRMLRTLAEKSPGAERRRTA
jgi:maleamate amidohydrolase